MRLSAFLPARPACVPLAWLAGLLAAAPFPALAAGEISQARDTYKEYISVRKLIGEETTAWQSEQVALADMIAVLKAEAAQIDEAMETLRSSASTADQRRAQLNEQLEQARATSTAFNDTIGEFEAALKSLARRMPDPLRRELQPLLARLPDEPDTTRLNYSQRLQSIIGVLAQTDKFNTDVKYVSEVKTVEGESFEVQTLYFGLASALFTDATGRYAGHGHPAADGWKWDRAAGADAAAIAHAMDVYLSRKSPAFVSVPLQVD